MKDKFDRVWLAMVRQSARERGLRIGRLSTVTVRGCNGRRYYTLYEDDRPVRSCYANSAAAVKARYIEDVTIGNW